jgi:hypothetical protein
MFRGSNLERYFSQVGASKSSSADVRAQAPVMRLRRGLQMVVSREAMLRRL